MKPIETLRAGGIVLFPTETSYGLAVDATNAAAVRKLIRFKGREPKKTFPLIAASATMVRRYTDIPRVLESLVRRHWPGPLTIVLPAKIGPIGPMGRMGHIAGNVIAADGTVAIRVSSHPVARMLSRRLGRPIVATSANLAGQPAAYSVRAWKKQTAGRPQPDAMIDAGALPRRRPSTIVAVKHGCVIVLRQGAVKL